MKRALSLMMGGALALLVGTAANAATTTGTVVATDAVTNTITIETETGKRFLFTRNDATKVEQKGVTVALGDIREKSRVIVTTAETPTDSLEPMLATRVDVDEMAVAAAPLPSPTSARVESARDDGSDPMNTAEVNSASDESRAERMARDDSAAERMDRDDSRAERLPTTATPLPLIALFGAGSLAAGLALRMRRSR
jgi:hypothetical protein